MNSFTPRIFLLRADVITQVQKNSVEAGLLQGLVHPPKNALLDRSASFQRA